MEIGVERYGFFKKRYFVKIGNITNYYYGKYYFVKAVVENAKELDLGAIDELEIDDLFNKIL